MTVAERSDTTEKLQGGVTGKGFVKGDPRINRSGRPKTFDQLRSLAQEIAHEVAISKERPVVINGKTVTVTEVIMRQWAQSKDPRLQQKFIEVAYGKTPEQVLLSGSVANVEMTVSEWQAYVEKQRRAAAETLADDGDE